MNWRRLSTSSPIRVVKTSSAWAASSSVTWSRIRCVGVHRRIPQLVVVHLAEALVALDRIVLGQSLADGQPGLAQSIPLAVGVGVLGLDLAAAPLELVQRRLGEEDVAVLDDRAHEPEQQRQQQRADVLAVDVGVGHQHDLVVAQPVDVELLLHPGAEGADDRLDLLVLQDPVDARLLDVEDLAADRQDRLDSRVAALLGRPAGGVALDDEQLALLRIRRLAVGQLARQSAASEQALATAGGVAGLPCGEPGDGGALCLAGDEPCPRWGSARTTLPSCSLTTRCTKVLASVFPSLVLVCPSNCGSSTLMLTIAVRPSRTSSPVRLVSFSFSTPQSRANLLTSQVSDARKPSSWVPPSWVLMVLAKVCTDSVNAAFHCIATSRLIGWVVSPLDSASNETMLRWTASLPAVEMGDVVDQAAVVPVTDLTRR